MMSEKKANSLRDNLLNDAAYLEDELKALKNVISAIPYEDRPLGQRSIKEMLMLVHHAQESYYLPVIKTIFSDNKPDFRDLQTFTDTFNPSSYAQDGADDIVDVTIAFRSELISILENSPVKDWNREAVIRGESKSIYDILTEMIQFERNTFKEIAERILTLESKRTSPKPT